MFDLPSDWSESELRNAAQKGALSFTDGDWIEAPYIASSGIRLLQTGNIGRGFVNDKPETRRYISLKTFDELGCKWVRHGDILICRLADPIGRACEVPEHLDKSITSVDVTILKIDPSEYSARYVLHYLNSEINLGLAADSAGGSTRSRISRTNLGQLPLPKPPLAQQQKIAEVFDTLDTQIQKTDALITKLEKVKEGLLHDLLTRGIDENGRLRPSPEQAPEIYKESPLGLIPRCWKLSTLQDTAELFSGGTPSKSIPAMWEGGIPFLTPKDMKRFLIDDTIDHISEEAANSASRIVPEDSIFLVVRGMILAHTFPVCLNLQPLSFNQDVKAMRTKDCIEARFLAYWMDANSNYFLRKTTESTHGTKKLDTSEIHHAHIGIPPKDEQQKIISRLKSVNNSMQSEISVIRKLKDQKSGLMDELLTGRVRVTPLLEKAQTTTPA